ncbi:MAG TPA: PAS domain S-box protein, partial [Prolixibacteraceae bacterium]|nr:PAS domain S-box protein [Prolixibacteraceae bacterium]
MNKAEEQFRILFEQAMEGVLIADSRGFYLDANPAACSMLGYTKEEITKLSIADVITEDEHARLAPEMEEGKREGTIKNHWKFKRKDQSVFIGEVKGTVLSDGRLQATVRNVTEEMNAREVINRSESHSRITLDSMLEGCQIIGFDWRYLYLNRTAEIHNRRLNKELLGNKFMDAWPGIEETEVYKAIKRALEDRIPSHFEFYFRFPDGGQGWYDLSIHSVPEGAFILSIDITERKMAEHALRDSEAKYRVVSENTDDWIYWVSPLGRFRYSSPACERITGYKPQEFMDEPSLYMEIVIPEDKERVHQHNMTPVEEQIIPHSFKFRISTKKGDLCWIDHSCTPLFTDGEYQGQIGTNRNITELKLTEERQYESELKFRKIFEEGPFGMALMNNDFKTIIANARLCSLLGFTESELQQRTFRDITAPEDVINDIQQIRKLIAGELSVYKTEKRYVRKDGQEIWGSITVTANFSDEGQFLHNLVIIEDITRRKQAEEELQIVTERLQLATSVSSVGILDYDISRNHMFWDEKIYELYGLDPQKETPSIENWLSRVHPDDLEYVTRISNQMLDEENKFSSEFRIIRPDQSVHWISAEGQIFRDDKGNPVRMIGVNYDITNRKLAEQELILSKAKLETAIASMSDAIFISDNQGQLIEFNEAFATFHKFRDKEDCKALLAQYPEFIDILYTNGEPVPFDQWAIPRTLKGEKAQNEEYIIKRKDTGESWVASFSFAPVRDANNQIIGSIVAGRDISESKKAEEALKESEERYRNIFESAIIGIYRTTPDGQIIMANPTLIRLLGFDSLEELMQRNLEEEGFDDKKHREEFRKSIEKDGAITGLEAQWKTKDGRSVYVSENAKAFYDNKGKVIYYEGTIEDITERKLMERTIRESEERFRKVFFTNPDSIAIKRMEDGLYVSVNIGFTQIFGYSEEDIIGKTN